MAIDSENKSNRPKFALFALARRIAGVALDKALDWLIASAILLVLGAPLAVIVIWGGTVTDWFGSSESLKRWEILLVVSACLSAPVIGGMATRKLRRARHREPAYAQVTCTPAFVDLGGIGPNKTTATVLVTDADGRPARNARIEWSAFAGRIFQRRGSGRTDGQGKADFTLELTDEAIPGTLTIAAFVLRENALPLQTVVDVTCVGGPAFITMAGSPSQLVVGESAQILVTVTDAIGQNVWDGTKVQIKCSTGQMKESVSSTFGGVATDFLLTNTPGTCTLIASAQMRPDLPPTTSQMSVQVTSPNPTS